MSTSLCASEESFSEAYSPQEPRNTKATLRNLELDKIIRMGKNGSARQVSATTKLLSLHPLSILQYLPALLFANCLSYLRTPILDTFKVLCLPFMHKSLPGGKDQI